MSVAGGRSVFLDTALALDDSVIEGALKLPRNTLSAAPAHRRSRGLAAVLVSFDRKVQAALRRLCFERMTLEARFRAEAERLQSYQQNLIREPDVMVKIRTAIADNDYNLQRMAGDAAPQILAALHDPEISENLQLAIASEEDNLTETDARLWRRNLDRISIPVRVDAPYRYAGHDSPNCKGARSITNVLNTQTGEERLSYYQRTQLKYGKGRRGSTSIAGAWEQVFSGGSDVPVVAQDQNVSPRPGTIPIGFGRSPPSLAPAYPDAYAAAHELLEASTAALGSYQAQSQAKLTSDGSPPQAERAMQTGPAHLASSPPRQALVYTTANVPPVTVAAVAVSPARVPVNVSAHGVNTVPLPLPGTGAGMAAASAASSLDPKLQDLLSRAKAMLASQMPAAPLRRADA